uniref:ATPase family AAA domain-containing protein 5b isoform X2 n=1 Tax=Monopterus albus TaxID=43700 RepID=UPI0009B3367E|nr:ATPase family AAA domain-containing protein 5-like isoform X2 [Monopterus albus]
MEAKRQMHFEPLIMRNKPKRSINLKDVTCQSKDQTQTAAVITLDSESSYSPRRGWASLVAKDKSDSYPASGEDFAQKGQPLQKSCCTKGVKIAPIFTRTKQQSESKWSNDGKLYQPVGKKQKSALSLQSNALQWVKSQQQLSTLTVSQLTGGEEPLSTWRGHLSPSALCISLEEIQTSDPSFPVQAVFSTLQRKARLQDCDSTENSRYPSSLQNHLKGKRKQGNESSEWTSKRQRCSLAAHGAGGVNHCHLAARDVLEKMQARSNKLSRTRRLRQRERSLERPVTNCEPNSKWTNHAESDSQSPINCDVFHRGSCFEDVLWTDKYSPQQSSEVIGNPVSVNKLHSWLKKWKLKSDCYERRKVEERKSEENSNGLWDCGDFQGEAGAEDDIEEPLCNAMLITGPPGVGKTASVYACAQELGFKIFEVNCSSQRSGHRVLSQLKEATQSHLVEPSGKDPLKPAYFKNYNSCTPKTKTEHPKNVISTSKRRAAQNLGRSGHKTKTNPATVTLANYFKIKAKADHLNFGGPSPSEEPDGKELGEPSPDCNPTAPPNKKTATSLILFEEVDVVFDDDIGFYKAIKTFVTTTKRPVILTTNDPSFKERFNCSLEEIIFKTPSVASVCSYLQLVGLAEGVQLELHDVSSLLRLTRGDIRRCLLQLQLWVHSGGGRASRSGGSREEPHHLQYSNAAQASASLDSQRPPCGTSCTANMLGLHPVTQVQLLSLLKCQCWSETDMNKLLGVLAESWRRCVPFLYSNLELLLSIGMKRTPHHFVDQVTTPGLDSELAPSDADLLAQQLNGNVDLKASGTNSKYVGKFSRLSRKKHDTQSGAPSSREKTEQKAAKVETSCLDALTDFFDLMSYLDATLPAAAPLVSGPCRPEAFVWTGAEIKDGLDELSKEEEDRSWSQERLFNIQAAVEGLGSHRCCWRVYEAWTEAQKYRQDVEDKTWMKLVERLTLPASSKRQSLNYSFQPLCAPSVSRRRYELSRSVFGSKSLGLLGNRQAVSMDYMPFLRSICRARRAQRQEEEPFRCVSHLSSTRLGLSKSTLQLLAEDFSETSLQESPVLTTSPHSVLY